MDALVFDSSKRLLSLKKAPVPKITGNFDVIIEVAYAGVCGTDLHIISGEFPCSNEPFILGHEISGIVKEVGQDVKHVKAGDNVAVDPQRWCSTCEFCTSGNPHCCPDGALNTAPGIYNDGGWANYCKVTASQVYLLSPKLSLKQGCLCEPMSCVVRGWERLGPIRVGSEVLVSGAGIIGNLWSSVLHHSGHRRVTVSEPSQARRILSSKLDLGYVYLTPEELKSQYETGWRVNAAIDCSGNAKAIEQAFDLLKPTGVLCLFGVAPPHSKISISPYEVFRKELTIVGALLNPFSFKKAIDLMEAMGQRYLDYKKLGVEEFRLKDYTIALEKLKNGEIAKAVFKIKA